MDIALRSHSGGLEFGHCRIWRFAGRMFDWSVRSAENQARFSFGLRGGDAAWTVVLLPSGMVVSQATHPGASVSGFGNGC